MTQSRSFTWGAAAASYQIEGKLDNDPRGLCVWDMFCQKPGNVRNGHNGDRACMHIQHYADDVTLMANLGLDAYRLSISWPRVLPQGNGKISESGLAFYDQLVDCLLAQGIAPWITLFHWDYPYDLFLKGGWLNPDSPKWFADYTQIIVDKLSDRVSHWMTLNEPQCFIHFGHHNAYHAPGLELGFKEVLTAAHHSLLAHGMATQVIRQHAKLPPKVGAAPVGKVSVPKYASPECITAAKQHQFAITTQDCWNNTWFADPMILGQYPEDGLALFEPHLPAMGADDLKIICQPLDFYGANIYTADIVEPNESGQPVVSSPPAGSCYTAMDWLVIPDCLYWAAKFFYERYQLPIIITENGMANNDEVTLNGDVPDKQRIDYVHKHIQTLLKARDEGIPVDGYFLWSIMDNFEWSLGYDRRFGLIHIDYETQKRTPKDSYYWYRDFIAANK